jgi:ATP-dependent helicase/nuclease subunit A
MEAREEQDEALRIFYVATTRARDCLILSAGTSPEDSPRSPAMVLLDSRFRRADGSFFGTLPEHWPSPQVAVRQPGEFAREGRLRKAAHRPKLLLAASRITRAEAVPQADVRPGGVISSGGFDLDDPASEPCSRVLTTLFRHLLSIPDADGEADATMLVDRIAKARGIWITDRTRDVATVRLMAWRASALGRSVAGAGEIRRAIPWTMVDPSTGMIVSSRIDFACRKAAGWFLVNVLVDPDEPTRERERTRLRVGIIAAERLGITPVAAAWLAHVGIEVGSERLL